MVTYKRPGVYVEEQLRTRNPSPSPSSTTAVFVASHGQGPLEPHLVRSWSDFTRVYGGFPSRTSLLPYSVFQFFNNGGRDAYILRITGAGPVVADTIFQDQGATPDDTILVEAVNPGGWGNNISIGIENSDDDAFNLTVYLGGTGLLNIVERFPGLTMDPDSAMYVETKINSVLSGSSYITVHDVNSSNLVDDEYSVVRPEETGINPVALTGGDNGAEPVTGDFIDGLVLLETIDRTYDLNFPGVTEAAVINAAIEHVADKGTGFVIIDPPSNLDVTGVIDWAEGINNSSYGAVYYPYVHISDPGANTPGSTRLVPPGGSIAGVCARTDASRGVWKAPAGLEARVSGGVSTERRFSNEDLEQLNSNHINTIRHAPGAGFVVWGARTLRKNRADMYVPIRRSLNWLRKTLQSSTEWAVFEPNDSNLWESLETSISRFLTGYWQQGGLRGVDPEEAFYVKCDADINPVSSIEAGVVNVEIGVALQYPAEFVVIKLSQWEGGSAVTEVA